MTSFLNCQHCVCERERDGNWEEKKERIETFINQLSSNLKLKACLKTFEKQLINESKQLTYQHFVITIWRRRRRWWCCYLFSLNDFTKWPMKYFNVNVTRKSGYPLNLFIHLLFIYLFIITYIFIFQIAIQCHFQHMKEKVDHY